MKRSVVNLTDQEIEQNLIDRYNSANKKTRLDGRVWYYEAQSFCQDISKRYKVDSYIVAAVTAILSPRSRWERNKQDAEAMIKAFVSNKGIDSFTVCNTHTNKAKAWGVLEGGVQISAKSPKTHSFAMNVGLLSPDHITIDSWHIRACLTQPGEGVVDTVDTITEKQYRRVEAITAKLAGKRRMKGYQFQAIVWLAIKQEWER
jgi:hypothetical protein